MMRALFETRGARGIDCGSSTVDTGGGTVVSCTGADRREVKKGSRKRGEGHAPFPRHPGPLAFLAVRESLGKDPGRAKVRKRRRKKSLPLRIGFFGVSLLVLLTLYWVKQTFHAAWGRGGGSGGSGMRGFDAGEAVARRHHPSAPSLLRTHGPEQPLVLSDPLMVGSRRRALLNSAGAGGGSAAGNNVTGGTNTNLTAVESCEEKRNNTLTEPLFPPDIFTQQEQRQGAILLHVILLVYMFAGLAIICDDYFESSLEAICEGLNLKEDVAGATFMAAGGSAPELFTSLMATFVTESDVGFGTIVGSAVFNVLFVIAMCAFVAPNLVLTWWPLARDCVYYCFSILVLVSFVANMTVTWYEALILFICYMGYIAIMYFNERLEGFVGRQLELAETPPASRWRTAVRKIVQLNVFEALIYIVIFGNITLVIVEGALANDIVCSLTGVQQDGADCTYVHLNLVCSGIFISEMLLKWAAVGFWGYWKDPLNAFDGMLVVLIFIEYGLTLAQSGDVQGGGKVGSIRTLRLLRVFRGLRAFRLVRVLVAQKRDAVTQTELSFSADANWVQVLVASGRLNANEIKHLQDAMTTGVVGETVTRQGSDRTLAVREGGWMAHHQTKRGFGNKRGTSFRHPPRKSLVAPMPEGAGLSPRRSFIEEGGPRPDVDDSKEGGVVEIRPVAAALPGVVCDGDTRGDPLPTLPLSGPADSTADAGAGGSSVSSSVSTTAGGQGGVGGAVSGGGGGGSAEAKAEGGKGCDDDQGEDGGRDLGAADVDVDDDGGDGGDDDDGDDDDDDGDDDDDDDDDDEPANPFEIPDGIHWKVVWALLFPLNLILWLSIPDCRRPMFEKLYLLTFTMCVVMIAACSFLMVWMATIIGEAAGIPPPVMGLTVLAAGTSIPDALSSIAVARRGHGDMAVSSSIGSNIFDILIGLPVPWLVKTAISGDVTIQSESLTLMVLTLFIMVGLVVSAIHYSGWLLTRKLGWMMMFMYGIFVLLSLLLEYCVVLNDSERCKCMLTFGINMW